MQIYKKSILIGFTLIILSSKTFASTVTDFQEGQDYEGNKIDIKLVTDVPNDESKYISSFYNIGDKDFSKTDMWGESIDKSLHRVYLYKFNLTKDASPRYIQFNQSKINLTDTNRDFIDSIGEYDC